MANEVVRPGETNAANSPSIAASSEGIAAQRSSHRRRHGYVVRLGFAAMALALVVRRLVPLQDVLFVGAASAYFYALGKLVFPSPTKERPPNIFPRSSLVRSYVAVAGVLSIPVPAAYVLASSLRRDHAATAAASPHLFLMTCQVLTEILTATVPVSLPVRALVPITYNTRRLFAIAAWLQSERGRQANWSFLGCGIAVANMALWTFNLLGFMLPVYLPAVMRKHYELERCSHGRAAEGDHGKLK